MASASGLNRPTVGDEDPTSRVNRYDKVATGNFSLQVLISTRDQVIHATGIEAGDSSRQIFGIWDDDSVQELKGIIGQEVPAKSGTGTGSASGAATGQTTSGHFYGIGKSLGFQDNKGVSK